METQGTNNMVIIAAVVALVVGAGGGYFIGVAQGEKAYIAEQQKAAQEAIAKKANPFAETVNPLGEGYKNPFERTVTNPFGQ